MSLPVSEIGRRYGVLHDAKDQRDFLASKSFVTRDHRPWWKKLLHIGSPVRSLEVSADFADLSSWLGPVKDQGSLGACTGFAGCGMREFLYRKYYDFEADKSVNPSDFVCSPLFLYYEERKLEGELDEDNGAQMRSIPYVLNHTGVCLEREHPYNPRNWKLQPEPGDYAQANILRGGAYHRITGGVDEMKAVLQSGYVFVAGIAIYQSFESDYVARTGVVPVPDIRREELVGYHAVLVHGFDDRKQRFNVRNSWGRSWGCNGNFFLPYQFASPQLMTDAWIQHLGKPWVPKNN